MSRAGLKRLECPNGCAGLGGRTFGSYMTLAQLEHGMRPLCPGCTAPLFPESPELWHLVPREELEASPQYAEHVRQCKSISHGQASHIQRGRQVRSDLEISGERIAKQVREAARERRRAGLVQYATKAAAAAEMPF